MKAGELRHRVTVQRQSEAVNSFGERVVSWEDVCTVWAAIEPLAGRDLTDAKQRQEELTTRVRIRYREGIKPDMRVIHSGQVLQVVYILDNSGKMRELALMCRQTQAEDIHTLTMGTADQSGLVNVVV